MNIPWTHIPIMAEQIADFLLRNPDGVYIDGTLGLGGHTRFFLTRLSAKARILGLDKDKQALCIAQERTADNRLLAFHASYTQAPDILRQVGLPGVDGILLDLGLSSYQLDDPSRGFSIMHNGPLDMRFDTTSSLSAADIVNSWPLHKLEQILRDFGEEHQASKIAFAIMRARQNAPIKTTEELKKIVENIIPRYGKTHPATQTFQALRIACNGELDAVTTALKQLPQILLPGGRAAILTFHSLEDRLVKNHFKELATQGAWKIITKHALAPDYEQIRQNRRARSAKLRVIERIN